ncbi:MAG TPA: tRNA guanosine(15) transglycosylase TgtA [Candidatus Bathyarchaeota archaeon]|nr:tRNA guanosine(15) transglycosylase TgtA [Candidatus Bathyarchaeota archaeon]
MSFEIADRDLMARIGRLKTKSGVIETPLLLPVINPNVKTVLPETLDEKFGCRALITNAYIIHKNFKETATEKGLHEFLNFNGSIMTDSGAYQLLIYKDIETSPEEIVHFQESIDTDIATILDIPTGWAVSKKYAQYTVNETIKRAKALEKMKTRDDIAWVGPVQGGQFLDLVAKSSKEMAKLPFQIHALGSPTPVMEQYKFDTLVDMIVTAKMNLPSDRPLHLFGAGHPFMFSLAVALGCDMFDSAAYALFARQDRYMTESGTTRLDKLEYFPCSCQVCSKTDPKTVKALPKEDRQKLLAEHNLHASFCELRRIKQAITEGRLWEHMEMRAHAHPALLQAAKKLGKYREYLEKQSPVTKRNGIFFFSSLGLARPEVIRYRKRLVDRYAPPPKAKILLLLPQTGTKPFRNSKEHEMVRKEMQQSLGDTTDLVHVCTYAAPFGVVPAELDDVYPLSQNEIASPLDAETVMYVTKQAANYIENTDYGHVILLRDPKVWRGKIAAVCRQACKKKHVPFTTLRERDPWAKNTIDHLLSIIKKAVMSV